MHHLKLILLTASTLALLPNSAHAWGKTGHRVTGEIAQQHLSRSAKKEIKRILGVEGLAKASAWADFMRASQDEFWTKEAGPYHYVTVPEDKTYDEVGAPPEGDAITALAKFKAILRDDEASIEDRKLALRFIVHIIGDLHQPLHAGNGTDRGGNDFKMTFFWEETNLHRVWDTGIIKQEELSYTEMSDWLSLNISKQDVKDWSVTDPVVWVTESAAIRDTIYPDADGERVESWGYVFDNRDIVRERLSQAGIRISAYLNEVFE